MALVLLERTMVLVVDDGTDQLETFCRGLFLLGVDTLTARDEDEALAVLQAPLGALVDVLLTDVSAPGRAATKVIDRALRARPALPVLVVTGLAPSLELTALRARGAHVLRKPFTLEELGRAISALLASRPPPSPKEE